MPREKLQITSINGGIAPTQDFGGDGSYQHAIGIDPDYSLTASLYRKSGALVPTRYEQLSTAIVTGAPTWLLGNPKNTDIYAYVKDPTGSAPELASLSLATDPNIKAYYKMSTGALTTDSSGQSHTLTNNNTVGETASGKFDYAADFGTANTNKSFTIADDLSISGNGNLSISFWLKLRTEISAGVYGLASHCSNTGAQRVFEVYYQYNAGTRRLAINAAGNSIVYNITLGTSDWYHIVAVRNGSSIILYVNGVQVATGTNGSTNTNDNKAVIGADRALTVFASAYMDDISYFGRVLTADEISSMYSNGGNFLVYINGGQGSEVLISAVANSNGNGAAYYNKYMYLATNATVARYGPLDGSVSYTASFWVTTLSKTALNNKLYPSIHGVTLPNHPMHVHGDNALYFGDTLNGQGIIHKIKTRKVTSEGDTDDGSTYNGLDLPFGFYPTDIESYGTDLAIIAIQTTDSDANQGRSALFLWDTVSDTFYAGPIWISDPIGTALLNVNGTIMVWSGSAKQGCRLSKYLGGVQLQEVLVIEEACPPLAGAVGADGNRVYWGGFIVYPSAAACVYSYGSKDGRLNQGLHIPIRASSVGAAPLVTALAFYSQTGFARTKLMVGWRDDTTQGVDRPSTTSTYAANFRSLPFNINKKFRVAKLRIPLGATLAENMSVTPTIYIDDESSNVPLTAITSANFSGRKALYKDNHLKAAVGENNFFLQIAWAGTVECPVKFPIEIEIETFDNEETI